MEEKIRELLSEVETTSCYGYRLVEEFSIDSIAHELVDGGAIVIPKDVVYCIVDKNTPFATVMPKQVDELRIYEAKNLAKYGYYLSKEAAELAIKSGEV